MPRKPATPKNLRAESITLCDKNGKAQAMLSANERGLICTFGSLDRLNIQLHVTASGPGQANISFVSPSGAIPLSFGAHDSGGGISIYYPDGKWAVSIGFYPDDESRIEVFGRDGQVVWSSYQNRPDQP